MNDLEKQMMANVASLGDRFSDESAGSVLDGLAVPTIGEQIDSCVQAKASAEGGKLGKGNDGAAGDDTSDETDEELALGPDGKTMRPK